MNYIDCKSIAQGWKDKIRDSGVKATLGIIQVGHDPASDAYVRGKIRDCKEVGFDFYHSEIQSENRDQVLRAIEHRILHMKNDVNGIIVQLPLPFGIVQDDIVDFIPHDTRDVDGFNENSCFVPCTPDAVMDLLIELNVSLDGKHCVVVGRSDLVGKPLAKEMQDADGTVTVCHSRTPEHLLRQLARDADVFVSAVGKPLIGTDVFKPGAVVIDVGIHRVDGKLKGDIFVTEDRDDIRITPVPGGVGLLTRAMLLKHVHQSYDLMNNFR